MSTAITTPGDKLLTEKIAYPSGKFAKYFYKTPIILYRLGMNKLVGRLIMIITTAGRKTGLPRHTAVQYHQYKGRKYVLVGWSQSDWYKNLLANPLVTIQTSSGTEHVRVRRITSDEELNTAWEMVEAIPMVKGMLRMTGMQVTREAFFEAKDRLIILTFDAVEEPTPKPVEPDLRWVRVVIVNLIWSAVMRRAIRRWKHARQVRKAGGVS